MPCLLFILVLAFPRVILAVLFFFSSYLDRAYHSILIPLLGFFFLPLTTLTYAWLVNSNMPIEGINVLFLIVAVLIDAGSFGGGHYYRRRQ
jgi:uncharacterized oligopeptide transporter (OPT) family protein